jgi:membrane fusion protein (multidrug efflux system)
MLSSLCLLLLAGGCTARAAKHVQPPPEAGYVVVAAQSVPLPLELAGRTAAFETSDVRPQVSGIIQARRFAEGALVKGGQTLYEIDPSLYKAAAAQAQANLQNAQATRDAAEAKAARYKALVQKGVVSNQDYADVAVLANQAEAAVAQTKAALDTANINLRFTQVPAPISGRIGRSQVTTGALVTNGQAQALTTIQRLDPIYVDVQQSSADLTALRRELAGGGVAPASAEVRLTLEDGSQYPLPGKIQFSEAMVDANTGAVTLRAQFPNPQGLLLPGMYVRARLTQAIAKDAILAPQQAVSRDPKGEATVMVVGPDNRAQQKTVKADRTVGADWLVEAGLSPGDKVITEGLDRIKPGQPIRPVPAGSKPSRTAGPGAHGGARS